MRAPVAHNTRSRSRSRSLAAAPTTAITTSGARLSGGCHGLLAADLTERAFGLESDSSREPRSARVGVVPDRPAWVMTHESYRRRFIYSPGGLVLRRSSRKRRAWLNYSRRRCQGLSEASGWLWEMTSSLLSRSGVSWTISTISSDRQTRYAHTPTISSCFGSTFRHTTWIGVRSGSVNWLRSSPGSVAGAVGWFL